MFSLREGERGTLLKCFCKTPNQFREKDAAHLEPRVAIHRGILRGTRICRAIIKFSTVHLHHLLLLQLLACFRWWFQSNGNSWLVGARKLQHSALALVLLERAATMASKSWLATAKTMVGSNGVPAHCKFMEWKFAFSVELHRNLTKLIAHRGATDDSLWNTSPVPTGALRERMVRGPRKWMQFSLFVFIPFVCLLQCACVPRSGMVYR